MVDGGGSWGRERDEMRNEALYPGIFREKKR